MNNLISRLTRIKVVDKLMVIPREMLLDQITEEKENFSRYSQLCALYQIMPDPLAIARHQGKIEILQILLQERITTKT